MSSIASNNNSITASALALTPVAADKFPLHTISVLVRNQPGVLVRVSLVFARRGYNIESLVVSPDVTSNGDFSRMTITCRGDEETLDQIRKQLQKLIDVVTAYDHTGQAVVETEIALVKLKADLRSRTEILQIAEHYNAKVVDYGPESLILRVYGESEKLDSILGLLRPFEVVELVRSGKVLMTRGLTET